MSQAPPHILLVEDDPVSRSFLCEALGSLPAQVDAAADIAQAVEFAARKRHALWVVDAHLPDGDGVACLAALRRCHETPALAITAGAARDELDALCAAGYLEVLAKPVSIALLQATVRRLLGDNGASVREPPAPAGFGKLPVWDQEQALAAIGGNLDSLRALRALFLDELPTVRRQLGEARANGDPAAMQALLHKLKASCRFAGAARMARAVDGLASNPLDAAALQALDFAITDALDSSDADAG